MCLSCNNNEMPQEHFFFNLTSAGMTQNLSVNETIMAVGMYTVRGAGFS